MPKLVCISGNNGAGKSTVAKLLANSYHNAIIVDTEGYIKHAVYDEKIGKWLKDTLGEKVLDSRGSIDIKKLKQIISIDAVLKEELYSRMSSSLNGWIDIAMKEVEHEVVILDGEMLQDIKYWGQSDYRVIVNARDQIRRERVMKRDNISEDTFGLMRQFDYSQVSSNIVIDNDRDIVDLNEQVKDIRQYLTGEKEEIDNEGMKK